MRSFSTLQMPLVILHILGIYAKKILRTLQNCHPRAGHLPARQSVGYLLLHMSILWIIWALDDPAGDSRVLKWRTVEFWRKSSLPGIMTRESFSKMLNRNHITAQGLSNNRQVSWWQYCFLLIVLYPESEDFPMYCRAINCIVCLFII